MSENQLTETPKLNDEDSVVWATKQLRELSDRVNSGERSALTELRTALDKYPWMSSVLGGNLAYQAETSLVNAMFDNQIAAKEALQRELEKKRAELSGENPTPIERLLIERVISCWLQVQHADLVVAQSKSVSHAAGDDNQRRQDRSNRRFLAAVKTLATVRRLALPIYVDVNVAAVVRSGSENPIRTGEISVIGSL